MLVTWDILLCVGLNLLAESFCCVSQLSPADRYPSTDQSLSLHLLQVLPPQQTADCPGIPQAIPGQPFLLVLEGDLLLPMDLDN